MVTSGLVCGLSAIAMPFAPGIWVLVPLLCIYGIGAAMQGTAPAAAVGDASGGRGGTSVAVYSMIVDLGRSSAPLPSAGWWMSPTTRWVSPSVVRSC